MPARANRQRVLPDLIHTVKKNFSFLLLTVACVLTGIFADVPAHPGHENVLSTKQAILRGKAIVRSLVRKSEKIEDIKLDEGWLNATENVDCRETHEYYLIAFDNHATDTTLYVLLTTAGKYLRSNFDGHFVDVAASPYPLEECS